MRIQYLFCKVFELYLNIAVSICFLFICAKIKSYLSIDIFHMLSRLLRNEKIIVCTRNNSRLCRAYFYREVG